MNCVNLIGRLTSDPEIKEYGKKGDKKELAKFTLAVQRRGDKDEADFIRCTAFGATAELIGDYLTKGARIGVTGRIQTGKYEDDDGDTRYTTDVIVESVTFADSKKEESSNKSKKSKKKKDEDDDD